MAAMMSICVVRVPNNAYQSIPAVNLMKKNSFASLNLTPALLQNIESLEFQAMTEIQAASLPAILSGKDVIGQAKTGSGKTIAFGLGVLSALDVKKFRIQSLILCPTRELADQVAKEIRKLARTTHNIKVLTLCGGMPIGPQIGSLEHGAHIIVGTPGRIEELLQKNKLKLVDLNTFVLDEADRMLDMGFQESLDNIISYLPKKRQTLLFSATYPAEIQAIASRVMSKPVVVKIAQSHDEKTIREFFFELEKGEHQRIQALHLLLLKHQPKSAIVFCKTKRETQELADELTELGFSVQALHGDMEQRDRDQALVRFSNKSATLLVATDVAARGLDVDNVDAVFNYQLALDPEVHVHRIGRTGRAGQEGMAFSFYHEHEIPKILLLEKYLNKSIHSDHLPGKEVLKQPTYLAEMRTLQIDGGKKQKVRAGDILGALTADKNIAAQDIGKITIFDNSAYVAVKRSIAKQALNQLQNGKIKGREFQVRLY
jgi:ATP-dependent RNA helicase DbpA